MSNFDGNVAEEAFLPLESPAVETFAPEIETDPINTLANVALETAPVAEAYNAVNNAVNEIAPEV
jgi:division protein CdvB (Snf7/Vps24/ESCRT-III family)